jgi:hypothetical protein
MKSKAVLFGINYINNPNAELRGCINDVNNMGRLLKEKGNFDSVKIYTDDVNEKKTRKHSIINSLYKLALDSNRFKLERVWIHFSGHGTHIIDRNGDEADRRDECIVPSDYRYNGIITDDILKRIFRYFYKDTKVTCVFDCCHSGTIGDLKYEYGVIGHDVINVNERSSKCKAPIILISGCMDNQTSADAYNVRGLRQFSGAMTSCLILALQNNKCIYDVIKNLREHLMEKQFTQIPQLTSSFELKGDELLL